MSARRGSAERPSRGSRRPGEQGPPRPEDLVDAAWFDAWGGGLVTTCGLSNVGAASEGHGLHGTYTSRAAADLVVERTTSEVTVTGTVSDPPFTLARRIVTSVGQGLVRIDDRIVNESAWTAAAPLLYHVNIGAPMWDDDAFLETDALEVVPRDEAAAAGLATWDEPPPAMANADERVFEHVGATWASIDESAPRHRADDPLVPAEALAVGATRERSLRAGDRARELLRARPRARHRRRARCRSSIRVRREAPG